MGAEQSAKAAASIDDFFTALDYKSDGFADSNELVALAPADVEPIISGISKDGKVKIAELKEALSKHELSKEAIQIVASKFRVKGCESLLSPSEFKLAMKLCDAGQDHLFRAWNEEAAKEGKPKVLMGSLAACNEKYPGGLVKYIEKAKVLLASSKAGANPFSGYTPEIPHGVNLAYGDEKFSGYEKAGLAELKGAAFVLVAGGLGERLGYGGIKVALPVEITTMTCYLQFYIQHILEFQKLANADAKTPVKLPLAIMTSGDTHDKTVELLKTNANFGMDQEQLTLIKQDKVPALSNNDAAFAVDKDDPFKLLTKPHGHGDVHLLLHQSGLAQKWAESGVKWISFFQDTNGLVFNAIPACLGVSKELGLEVNSLTVPRKPGEAVGAICKLVPNEEGKKKKLRELTVNVEYNQLDALLKTTPVGGDQPDAKTGLSPYPGNINILVFAAEPFANNLKKSHGVVPEFVNPKYKDKEKTVFKKPTRLECMMQDYPRLCEEGAKIGFTSLERWCCFSAVKNNTTDAKAKAEKTGFGECGCTGEADAYKVNRKKLKIIGVDIDDEGEKVEILGIPCSKGAKVVFNPSFSCSLEQLKSRFPNPSDVKISTNSTLVLEGDITIKSLDLNGTLIVTAAPGASVVIDGEKVSNDGYQFKMLDDPEDKSVDEKFRIRGYVLDEKAATKYTCDKAGKWVVKDNKAELIA